MDAYGGYEYGVAAAASSEDDGEDVAVGDEEEEEEEEEEEAAASSSVTEKQPLPSAMQYDDNDDDDEDDDEYEVGTSPVAAIPAQLRGKPEAMSASMILQKMAHAGGGEEESEDDGLGNDDDDDDDDDDQEVPVAVAEPTTSKETATLPTAKKPSSNNRTLTTLSFPSRERKKPGPKPGSKKKRSSTDTAAAEAEASSPKLKSTFPEDRSESPVDNLMDQPTSPITEDEYKNLESLMDQFCRVPLLAEFSRPVKMLHPDLHSIYQKIVTHPVDLGHVCRGIRRRQYKNSRDLKLDMWRVFANCVKFHSHPSNKDKVPSFVSIALHLREYFNALWHEYMLPSELPPGASNAMRLAIRKRSEERKRRLDNSGVLMMSKKFLNRVSRLLGDFIENRGRTDILDKTNILGPEMERANPEVREVARNLRQLQTTLQEMSERQEEYSIDDFNRRLTDCYCKHGVLEDNPALRNQFRNRLDRLVGKLTVPLHEANSRGVTQSSIWGNIATTIWARESGKKPYWPALCLGILPPEDQREGWHLAVTERNENRLPQKLRMQLMGAKRKCEAAQKRQSLSYFLVEFLGTHEFIWVRETDIVEKFDPKDDPNKAMAAKGAKKRASRSAVSSVVGSKTYATALEECEWATDEFEQVLQEAFDFESDKEPEEGDGEFMNYSYALLNQSDEEAEREDQHGYSYDETRMSMSDVEESNWLLAHEGKIDTSTDARKQAKKRALALKKKKAEDKQKKEAAALVEKKEKKKKLDAKQKEREAVKEQKELDKRRKKRSRERDKQLKADMKKSKKKRVSGPNPEADQDIHELDYDNKRARATAIVKAYIHRMAEKKEYQSLYLGGSSVIPAATVESSGLLSMALAFRVAAGELDDTDGTNIKTTPKPWELIDTVTPKTHQERTARLEQKRKLLEAEVERLRANIRRRKGLLHDELNKKAQEEAMIQEDDARARTNIWFPQTKGKKKKTSTKPPPVAPVPSTVSSHPTHDEDQHPDEEDAEEDDSQVPSVQEEEDDEEEEEEGINDESVSQQDDEIADENDDEELVDDDEEEEDG